MKGILKSARYVVAVAALGAWANTAVAADCVVDEQGNNERFYVATPPADGDCYDYGKPNLQGTAVGNVVFGNNILELPDSTYTDFTQLLTVNMNDGTFSIATVGVVPWILVLKQGSSWAAFELGAGQTSGSYFSCVWDSDAGECSNDPTFVLSHAELYGAVPIPAAAWLLGSGLLGLLAVGRRRKGAQVAAA